MKNAKWPLINSVLLPNFLRAGTDNKAPNKLPNPKHSVPNLGENNYEDPDEKI